MNPDGNLGISQNFNTSHVNVNRVCTDMCRGWHKISIHLMLMLIRPPQQIILSVQNFNTSHVNVNHSFRVLLVLCVAISIHLMLMLIIAHNVNESITDIFQYISC